MSSLYTTDKPLLMRLVLDHHNVHYHDGRHGYQKISCPGPMHANGDRHPSASVNMTDGMFTCFACGMRGDGYDLMEEMHGYTAKNVNEMFGLEGAKEGADDTWLF